MTLELLVGVALGVGLLPMGAMEDDHYHLIWAWTRVYCKYFCVRSLKNG